MITDKALYLITFITIVPFQVNGQGEWDNWLFGENLWVQFNNGVPEEKKGSAMVAMKGSASVSDSLLNLLFYTNGATVWNSEHLIMVGGSGLLGSDSSTQSSLIIPHPGNNYQYYLFTTTGNRWVGWDKSHPPGLRYHIIDMRRSNGLGTVAATTFCSARWKKAHSD